MNIENVLELIKQRIESMTALEDRYLISRGNDNGFERLVPEVANLISQEISPNHSLEVISHLGHHFPDLDLILDGSKFGIELKSRNNGSWITNGNSVFESISEPDYSEIFIMFGSRDKDETFYKVRYLPYWQATSNIAVTHSPRFMIDVNSTTSVFNTKNDYDTFRDESSENKIDYVQKFLKHNSRSAKWYINQNDTIPPISYRDLPDETKQRICAELFILFPNDLLNGPMRTKYDRSAQYLISTYSVYYKSFRDLFSAGGQLDYNGFQLPKMIETMLEHSDTIRITLNESSNDFKKYAYSVWIEDGLLDTPSNVFNEDYKTVLNTVGFLFNNKKNELSNAKIFSFSEFILPNT